VQGLLVFVVFVCVWVYFCCSGGYLCQGLKGLGMCKVGIVGWSASDECVGGRCRLVTGWGRLGGEGEGRGREWVRRGKTSFGEESNAF
jgi:hypothetical protein